MKSVKSMIAAAILIVAAPGLPLACTFSATALNFGSFGFLTFPVDSTATLTVNCPIGAAYQMSLSGTGGSGANNILSSGTNQIGYGVYKDAARNDPWGEAGGEVKSAVGIGADEPHVVYGRIPAQTAPVVGSYSDVLSVTITY